MRVPLYDRHVALGAKIVDFAGWQMPLHYGSSLSEHRAVRESAGLFDVSHMARVSVVGADAAPFMEWIATNRIKPGPLEATYTCLCNASGGTVDDVMVYKESDESFFIVCNASRREADLAHLREQAQRFRVEILEPFHQEGILALQGPFVKNYFPLVKPMTFEKRGDLIVAGTGYTGSGGVEIFAPHAKIIELWDQLLSQGIAPIGLGARDSLRLEKGYALYGHELSETIAPLESVSAWTVAVDKDFLGKEGQASKTRRAAAVILEGPGLARPGFEVFQEGKKIGEVTSGGFSPSLKMAIALVLAEKKLFKGESLSIAIRGELVEAKVVSLPFI